MVLDTYKNRKQLGKVGDFANPGTSTDQVDCEYCFHIINLML